MRVVVAPDSFKGSIAAATAAQALARGWRGARPGDEVVELPLADGGEGTLEVLARATGRPRWHRAMVSGPGAGAVRATWLQIQNESIIELARAGGLPLLAAPDPLGAHTTGVGELCLRALANGTRRIVVTLGGSASTDGGTGALTALGARFLDRSGGRLPRGGGALAALARVDLSGLRRPPPGGVTLLTDVRAPLLGPAGAAAVYGPQKGAGPADVAVLGAGLARLADLLGGDPAAPGAGAAGGTGYGLAAAWGARITPGAPEVCRLAGLERALRRADLVITGEGRYDATSADGKVTGTVLAAARRAGVPAAVAAGVVATDPPPGTAGQVSLADLADGAAAAMAEPARWLREAGRRLALMAAGRP